MNIQRFIFLIFGSTFFLFSSTNLSANISQDSIDHWNKNSLSEQFNIEDRIAFAKRALKVAEDIQYTKGLYFSYLNLGTIHYTKGNFEVSMQNFQEAIMVADDLKNKEYKMLEKN